MNYLTVTPPVVLEPFVDCFWLLAAPKAEGEADVQIVLPDGKTELIVHFGDPFLKQEKNKFIQQAPVLMSGQLTKKILLKPTGNIGVVAARFKPAGAARFFNLPYEKLTDQVFDFAIYAEEAAQLLQKEIVHADSHDMRLSAMQNLLLTRLKEESQEDLFVRQACRYITQSEGEYSVQELAKLIGFSERQLERKFKKQVGLSPKLLSRIVRFQKFLLQSKTASYENLTDAALACGYFDQSHFIRDFTKFSGISPVHYLKSNHPMSDHFTTPLSPNL